MTKKQAADIVKAGAEVAANSIFGPVGGAAVKIMGSVLSPLAEYVTERRERYAKEFVEHFVGSGYPQETATPLLEAEMSRAPAATKDAVFDALRALDETLTDRVIPALALLARDYVRAGRPKDRFFVGALRLFRDLEDSEYEELRGFVLSVAGVLSARSSDLFVAKVHWPDKVVLWISPDAEMPWRQSYESLLRTLTAVGFAAVPTGWSNVSLPGAHVYGEWKIDREPWIKLGSLLQHDTRKRAR